jgi:phosphopantetheinyl transferase (holo-ACP synthase)
VAKNLPHGARLHVSLSDDAGMAMAFVVVETP